MGLLDFGSVGRIDTRMRVALQRLFLAVDRNDPAMLTDALLEIVERPDVLDEDQLHRSLGRFLARHVTPGLTIDRRIFTDLFRVVFEHGLSVPAELTIVVRALVTVEGALTRLSPGFDIVAETRRFAALYLTEQLHPRDVGAVLTDELVASFPMLLRLPRRIDRIGAALEMAVLILGLRPGRTSPGPSPSTSVLGTVSWSSRPSSPYACCSRSYDRPRTEVGGAPTALAARVALPSGADGDP